MPSSPSPASAPDPSGERAHDLRIAIGRLARRTRQEKAASDLGDSHLAVLGLLAEHGPLTLGQLSEHERVTPPSMTRTVAFLVEEGCVRRDPSPDDGRKVVITLTEWGTATVAETRRRRDEWFSRRLEALEPEEQAALDAALPVLRKLAGS